MDDKDIIFIEVENFTIPEDLKIAREEARKCFEKGYLPAFDALYPDYFPKDMLEIKVKDDEDFGSFE